MVWLAAVLAGAATWWWVPPGAGTRRLGTGGARPGDAERRAVAGADEPGAPRRTRLAVVVAALAVGWLVGGPTGWVLAVGVGWALGRWVSRAEPAGAAARRRTRAAALPTSVDLLVACLRAGADPLAAVTAVADSSPDTLGRDLGLVARRLELGATPAEAWALAEGTDLQAVARVVARSSATGAPVADLLETLAVELRAQRREQWLGDARQLGTRSAAPLGLCFLPGFVLLGVVPVVVGLAGGLW